MALWDAFGRFVVIARIALQRHVAQRSRFRAACNGVFMVVKVLVVDDSGFFRRRVTEILSSDPNIKVVGTASNGKEAIDLVLSLKPDVITMDYEMPMMDGITAVRQIMQRSPTPVLMFSSLTHEGARVTLDALDAGAVDFLPKNFEDISRNPQKVKQLLCEKVHSISRSNRRGLSGSAAPVAAPVSSPAHAPIHSPAHAPAATPVTSRTTSPTPAPARPITPRAAPAPAPAASSSSHPPLSGTPKRKNYKLVAIGTSTGGPVALQRVLTQLPASFPAPIVLIQHMPAAFTKAFAERLDKLCKISVKEAEDGDILRPGLALLAPGGKQMMIDGRGSVKILPGDERLNYKPCVDITFGSAAKSYGDKVLAVVLTGMGADGREGARLLKQGGSHVWAQDEASCVIYGMPMAIVKADLADAIYSLDDIGRHLVEACV
ncbi:Chemotaxis response regulator protein-glutamate methylesterase [Pseudomonas savastanoi pv. glycinea]|nr:Chemotaxis response regulator protein-glutamate methylesterase [Pseudomonas savastanoi pv. glycinea]